jgi:cation transport ATPase
MVFGKIKALNEDITTSVKRRIDNLKKKGNVYEIKTTIRNGEAVAEEDLRRVAEHKYYFKKSFIFHACIFIIGNLLLFTINMLFSPNVQWYMYSLIGWVFIGTIMHVGSYSIFASGVTPSFKRAIIYNILAYVSVMPFLVIINLITLGSVSWVLYPMFFWGAGVVILVVIYSMIGSGDKKEKKEKAIQKELAKLRDR